MTNQPIDYDELAQLVGDDIEDFLEMMTPIFLEDTQTVLQTLEEAVQSADSKKVAQAAHTLKGSSASMAMIQLSAYSYEIESMGKANELTNAPQKLLEIQAEYKRVEAALAKFLETAV